MTPERLDNADEQTRMAGSLHGHWVRERLLSVHTPDVMCKNSNAAGHPNRGDRCEGWTKGHAIGALYSQFNCIPTGRKRYDAVLANSWSQKQRTPVPTILLKKYIKFYKCFKEFSKTEKIIEILVVKQGQHKLQHLNTTLHLVFDPLILKNQ